MEPCCRPYPAWNTELSIVAGYDKPRRTRLTRLFRMHQVPRVFRPTTLTTWAQPTRSGLRQKHDGVSELPVSVWFNKKVNYAYRVSISDPPYSLHNVIEYKQEDALKACPGHCLSNYTCLSFGITFNIWYQGYMTTNGYSLSFQGSGCFPHTVYNSNQYWWILLHGRFRSGAKPQLQPGNDVEPQSAIDCRVVFKSPFEARLRHDYLFRSTIVYPTSPGNNKDTYIPYPKRSHWTCHVLRFWAGISF